MKMNIENFKKVIANEKLPKEFTSHQFLQVYRDMFEEEYIEYLSKERGGFRKLHGPIGSYLRRKESILGIRKIDSKPDKNIKGNISSCALWRKVKN